MDHAPGRRACERVVAEAGGAWNASLNLYRIEASRPDQSSMLVATQQIDDKVFVIGEDRFDVGRHALDDWTSAPGATEAAVIECDDAVMAWELLRLLRDSCLVWQCGACDGWIYTSDRPRIGILQCSTCRTGGVDFRHADRHVGEDG